MGKIFEINTRESKGRPYFSLDMTLGREKVSLAEDMEYEDIKNLVLIMKREFDELLTFLEEQKNMYEEKSKVNDDESFEPEKVWKHIEAMEDDEIFPFFNSLPYENRKKLSSYVFSSVNMFKGKGLIFATCFNQETYFLERDEK